MGQPDRWRMPCPILRTSPFLAMSQRKQKHLYKRFVSFSLYFFIFRRKEHMFILVLGPFWKTTYTHEFIFLVTALVYPPAQINIHTCGWIFSSFLSLSPWSKNSVITRSAACVNYLIKIRYNHNSDKYIVKFALKDNSI